MFAPVLVGKPGSTFPGHALARVLFGKPGAAFPGHALAAGHGRKESDLARAGNRRTRPHMTMVDSRPNDFRILECVRVLFVASGEPRHQLIDCGNTGRRIEPLFRLAPPLAHPGKIKKVYAASRAR